MILSDIECLTNKRKLRIPIVLLSFALLVSFAFAPDFWLEENLEPRFFYYVVLAFIPVVYFVSATVRGLVRGCSLQNSPNLKTFMIVLATRRVALLRAERKFSLPSRRRYSVSGARSLFCLSICICRTR